MTFSKVLGMGLLCTNHNEMDMEQRESKLWRAEVEG